MENKDEKLQDDEILEKLINYYYEVKEYLVEVKNKKEILEQKIIGKIRNKRDKFFETKYVVAKLKNRAKVKSQGYFDAEQRLINELISQEKYEFIDFNMNNKYIKKLATNKDIFEKYRKYIINEDNSKAQDIRRDIIDYLYNERMINVLSVNREKIINNNEDFNKVLIDKFSQLLDLSEYQLDINLK